MTTFVGCLSPDLAVKFFGPDELTSPSPGV
jgi:hypothetical protein